MTAQDKRTVDLIMREMRGMSRQQQLLLLAYANGLADGSKAAQPRKQTKEA
jgi:hypothetical protein